MMFQCSSHPGHMTSNFFQNNRFCLSYRHSNHLIFGSPEGDEKVGVIFRRIGESKNSNLLGNRSFLLTMPTFLTCSHYMVNLFVLLEPGIHVSHTFSHNSGLKKKKKKRASNSETPLLLARHGNACSQSTNA